MEAHQDLGNSFVSPLRSVLKRLVEVLEDENAALERHEVISHAAYTDRKNQALRDVMTIQMIDGVPFDHMQLQPLLACLARALRVNQSLLKLHITAVGEVSDVIIEYLCAAESDGTYSRCLRSSRKS